MKLGRSLDSAIWVVVKIMVHFGSRKFLVPYYTQDPKRGYNFDSYPYTMHHILHTILGSL